MIQLLKASNIPPRNSTVPWLQNHQPLFVGSKDKGLCGGVNTAVAKQIRMGLTAEEAKGNAAKVGAIASTQSFCLFQRWNCC